MKSTCHQQYLHDRNILPRKAKKPEKEIPAVVIGVLVGSDVAVVQVVFRVKTAVVVVGKQTSSNGSDDGVELFVSGGYYAVHGIMGSNEKAGVQVRHQEHRQISKGGSEINRPVQQQP